MMLTSDHATDTPTEKKTSRRMGAEEERRLAVAWRTDGDRAARERLVTENLGLVVAIAQRYRQCGVPLDELIAEGNLGLLHAVDGFDPDCGSRLSTYAAYWIRQGISRAFAANSPRGQMNGRDRRDVSAVEQATRVHYAIAGQEPTVAELASEMGWPRERVELCKQLATRFSRPSSLDQPRPPREVLPGSVGVNPDAGEDQAGAAAAVEQLFQELSDKERSVVEMRFGMHGTEARGLDEIATSLATTRRETRTLLRTALAKIARRRSVLSMSDGEKRREDSPSTAAA